MVLAQKQTHRSIEQNREPRNKPAHIWSIYDKDLNVRPETMKLLDKNRNKAP